MVCFLVLFGCVFDFLGCVVVCFVFFVFGFCLVGLVIIWIVDCYFVLFVFVR